MKELWDAYLIDETKANIDLVRGETIPEGLFHIIVETLIVSEDNFYLVMQRDFTKDSNPGLFEGSAGGSILKGETPLVGAKREVAEETSLVPYSFTPIYHYVYPKRNAITKGFVALIKAEDKDKIVYQKGETINHKWLTKEELLAFIETDAYNPRHRIRLRTYLNQEK